MTQRIDRLVKGDGTDATLPFILGAWYAVSFCDVQVHGACEGVRCVYCADDRRLVPWFTAPHGRWLHERFVCHGCFGTDCGNLVCPCVIRHWKDCVSLWQCSRETRTTAVSPSE